MTYHNFQPLFKSTYDKADHIYTEIDLAGRALATSFSDEWHDAVLDAEGCTIILPVEFAQDYKLFRFFGKQLIDTGRLSEIEYINNVNVSSDTFEQMNDEEKASLCKVCVRIRLEATQQSIVMMKSNDNEDWRSVPYEDLKENHVLSIERYPKIDINWNDVSKEALSLHVGMDIYKYPTGNAPDVLLMMGDVLLRGIDDLPAVVPFHERPQFALRIDLDFWFPEFLRALLFIFQDYIIYGTAPGQDGEEQRLCRILKLRISRPTLTEQMHFMQNNDLNLDTSLSSSSLNSEQLKNMAAIGLATVAATTAVTAAASTAVTALGTAMIGLSSMTVPLALLGLGVWGANKLLHNHNDEYEPSISSQDKDSVPGEKQNTKNQIIDHGEHLKIKGVSFSYEEQNKEGIRKRVTYCDNDKKFKSEAEMSKEDLLKAKEYVLYRNKLDSIVCTIMHDNTETNYDRLSELASVLNDLPGDVSTENYAWLHKIKTYEIENVFRIIEDIQDILGYILHNTCVEPFEKACPRCVETLDENFSAGNGFVPNLCYALLKAFRRYEKQYREKQTLYTHQVLEEERVRAEERQNVLYEMSHHIKNLVVSVIDPLENLYDNMPPEDKFVLKTAIKGASMIREIVFFITNSYRFTLDDFLYDLSNPVETPQSLGNLFENALRASVASMFDKQTHYKYMRLYYPTRESFTTAKNCWYEAQTLADVFAFMGKHMNIDVSVDFHSFVNIILGNKKGSATNMAILFNELTMNMLKALAIVPKNERSFFITTKEEGANLCLIFKNACRNSKTVSKGYGKTIVANIIKGFGGTLTYDENERYFEVMTSIPFFKQSHITTNEENK